MKHSEFIINNTIINKSSWKVWCFFISKYCDQLLFLLTLFIGSIWRGALWHLIESHYRFLTQWPTNLNIVHYLLKHIRQDGGRGGDTILRINVLNTAHFCILCVLNILCHISCWGSTWKFHVFNVGLWKNMTFVARCSRGHLPRQHMLLSTEWPKTRTKLCYRVTDISLPLKLTKIHIL